MKASYCVPMVENTFKVLECFYDADEELSLNEISLRTRVSKSSAFRILFTLDRLGYIGKNPTTGKYYLGLKIREVASKALPSKDLVHSAQPFLIQLRDLFNETVNLAGLRGTEIVYLEIVESRSPFRMAAEVGSRVPWHSTALGKSIAASLTETHFRNMLAENKLIRFTRHTVTNRNELMALLSEVRKRGYSFDDEETELGASCISAPILDSYGNSIAAISVAGPTPRIRAKRRRMIRAVVHVAKKVAEHMQRG